MKSLQILIGLHLYIHVSTTNTNKSVEKGKSCPINNLLSISKS